MATVVLGTADGRRADPATPGIRRLVHRPGGVLTHWRRDGCGQPVPGMINAWPRSTGQCVVIRPTILCSGYSVTATILCDVSYAVRTYVYCQLTGISFIREKRTCGIRFFFFFLSILRYERLRHRFIPITRRNVKKIIIIANE